MNIENQNQHRPSLQTLQIELNRLKQQLQIEASRKLKLSFEPHNFSRPALGQVIHGFEWSDFQKSWRLHAGVDISVPEGSNIIAAAAGTVTKIEKANGGFSVVIDHGNGWESSYSDLLEIQVKEGQEVLKGVIIGTSSPVGIHSQAAGFHFGIYHDQQAVNPQSIIEGL